MSAEGGGAQPRGSLDQPRESIDRSREGIGQTRATIATGANGLTRGSIGNGRRSSNRAEVTREAILDAARVVFVAEGYVDTSIAAIVEAAGASVGSLYHHFGGKADVFLALYQRYETATWKSATEAVAATRETGQHDPVELFLAGARAYLQRCRVDADLTELFLEGDGPPGFVKIRRDGTGVWVHQNSRLIRADERRNGEALVHVLTTVAGAAGREVAAAGSDQRAEELTEDFLELLRRTATPVS